MTQFVNELTLFAVREDRKTAQDHVELAHVLGLEAEVTLQFGFLDPFDLIALYGG